MTINKSQSYSKSADSSQKKQSKKQQPKAHAKNRIVLAMLMVSMLFCAIVGKLVYLGFQEPRARIYAIADDPSTSAVRPKILDRNGEVLAMDIQVVSLFANPAKVFDIDETYEKLSTVLPDLSYDYVSKKLKRHASFVWLKREITPKQQARIHALGLPGIGFRPEHKRFYPGGNVAAHVLGHVNIDNQGIAGIEKYIDGQGLADLQTTGLSVKKDMKPEFLSVDLRVQHVLHDVLEKGMVDYRAIGASGVVLDVKTGEIVAMASLPDYDPNNPKNALEKKRLNRMSAGTYEMGSVFKAFTIAMALDSGKVNLNTKIDARNPIRIGGSRIGDFHAKKRWLSVPEVFVYSSNIGTAKMAGMVGIQNHKAFLKRLGLTTRLDFELPEVARPHSPKKWKQVNSYTIAFGHGISTTPLQTAVAAAALMNGGKLIPPTLFPRSEEDASAIGTQVISRQTSKSMRYLMRKNVLEGSGRKAAAVGYRVGGKTGTAEKVENGRYSKNKLFNSFLATFPVDDPRYIVLVSIDEPKKREGEHYATAAWNAGIMVGQIIKRAAPMLGVSPKFGEDNQLLNASY